MRPADPHPNADPDPRLDALLDRALAPADPPAGLVDRILERTPRAAPREVGEASQDTDRPAVAGGIGPARRVARALAVAAAAAVVGAVALWQPWHGGGAVDPAVIASVERDFDRIVMAEALASEQSLVDRQLDTLALRVAYAGESDPWADPDAALTEAAAEHELSQWSEDLPLLF